MVRTWIPLENKINEYTLSEYLHGLSNLSLPCGHLCKANWKLVYYKTMGKLNAWCIYATLKITSVCSLPILCILVARGRPVQGRETRTSSNLGTFCNTGEQHKHYFQVTGCHKWDWQWHKKRYTAITIKVVFPKAYTELWACKEWWIVGIALFVTSKFTVISSLCALDSASKK